MSRRIIAYATLAFAAVVIAAAAYTREIRAQESPAAASHQAPAAKDGGVVVMLCDGKTSMEVKGLKAGQSMSHEQAIQITRELMAKWQREHPDQKWQMAQQTAQADQSSQP